MRPLKTPGVYTEEISAFPPSVVPVDTAIPAFIGYTEKRPSNTTEAHRITSISDYHALFGGPFLETFDSIDFAVVKNANDPFFSVSPLPAELPRPSFWLYYHLQLFFANGGGPCFIVSIGKYSDDPNTPGDRKALLEAGLKALRMEDVPTLILLPDLLRLIPPTSPNTLSFTNYYSVYQKALQQCSDLKDRFTLIDIHDGDDKLAGSDNAVDTFRLHIGTNHLNYGATYYPWLESNLSYALNEAEIEISGLDLTNPAETVLKYDTTDLSLLEDVDDGAGGVLDDPAKKLHYESRSLFHIDNGAYSNIVNQLSSFGITMPPSGAIAGIYAAVDNNRGVFKAPANVSLTNVVKPAVKINNDLQEGLNVHPTGKSVNAIRSFPGRGILVWGARTLDGNSNDFRYISVRRFFIFAEESIKKAIERFVFEPNSEGTWVKVKGTVESFLTDQWRAGALAGATPNQAFFVKIGLGETMTPQDILEGKLIVLVGMAAVRPAEFILLRFTHKLQEA